MTITLIRNARLLTMDHDGSPGPRRGRALADLRPVDNGWIRFDDTRILDLGTCPMTGGRREADDVVDAAGRVVMPAFIDAHTHACWAGDRLDEWEMKQRGATYLDILKAGGGIMSTVRAVRQASEQELAAGVRQRLDRMRREGTTTVEIKSGYGLTTGDELKMLRAIDAAAATWPGTATKTALIAHAKDNDQPDFVARTISETLPAVHEACPGITVDAYCEQGAWSRDETVALFEAARALGHPLRVHADQFNELGMLEEAVRLGAVSVDHLEATGAASLERLARSRTFGVMLPCSGFHVDGRYADGRRFVDAGGALVIATNCNPGSAPTTSMPMAIALAVRHLGLSAAEAIAACTVNAAALLGFDDRGALRPGLRSDLLMLDETDERQLGYSFGGNPVARVW
ncbi:MAG: imidazolonepropionase [Phycisphaerales bacterium]|nr:imidazolonepropionase [Phycisphaerales bacterium]